MASEDLYKRFYTLKADVESQELVLRNLGFKRQALLNQMGPGTVKGQSYDLDRGGSREILTEEQRLLKLINLQADIEEAEKLYNRFLDSFGEIKRIIRQTERELHGRDTMLTVFVGTVIEGKRLEQVAIENYLALGTVKNCRVEINRIVGVFSPIPDTNIS